VIKIIDFVSKYLSVEFSFTRQRTVASITSGLQKTVVDLENHAEQQQDFMALKAELAAKALKEREDHALERSAALKIAANIKGLLA
jgi:hypothetical protein